MINDDKTFYIDGTAFPRNSRSPVSIKSYLITIEENRLSIGTDKLSGRFIGVVGEYLPYQEAAISAQTGRVRVLFEENTAGSYFIA